MAQTIKALRRKRKVIIRNRGTRKIRKLGRVLKKSLIRAHSIPVRKRPTAKNTRRTVTHHSVPRPTAKNTRRTVTHHSAPMSGSSLMPTRIIFASNNNSNYIQYWEPIAKLWREVHGIQPTLVYIGNHNDNVNRTVGDVITIHCPPGVPSCFAAQMVRLLVPAHYPNDICMVSDIDLFLTSTSFLKQYTRGVNPDQWISLNRYGNQVKNRVSMCYQIAKGSTFKKVLGVNSNPVTWGKTISAWYKGHSKKWATDELILISKLKIWSKSNPGKWVERFTPGLFNKSSGKIISRYLQMKYDENTIKSGQYIELEPRRLSKGGMQDLKLLEKMSPGYILPPITFHGVPYKSRHPDSNIKTVKKGRDVKMRNVRTKVLKRRLRKLK